MARRQLKNTISKIDLKITRKRLIEKMIRKWFEKRLISKMTREWLVNKWSMVTFYSIHNYH